MISSQESEGLSKYTNYLAPIGEIDNTTKQLYPKIKNFMEDKKIDIVLHKKGFKFGELPIICSGQMVGKSELYINYTRSKIRIKKYCAEYFYISGLPSGSRLPRMKKSKSIYLSKQLYLKIKMEIL